MFSVPFKVPPITLNQRVPRSKRFERAATPSNYSLQRRTRCVRSRGTSKEGSRSSGAASRYLGRGPRRRHGRPIPGAYRRAAVSQTSTATSRTNATVSPYSASLEFATSTIHTSSTRGTTTTMIAASLTRASGELSTLLATDPWTPNKRSPRARSPRRTLRVALPVHAEPGPRAPLATVPALRRALAAPARTLPARTFTGRAPLTSWA